VAGTYDVAEAAARAKRAAEVAAQARPVMAEFRAAGRERNWARAVELADTLVALDPAAFGGLAQWKFRTMIAELNDVRGAYDYIRPLTEGLLKDNAEAINSVAWTIVDEPGLEPRDLDLALKLAERAAELTKRENGLILDTLAVALFQRGEVARAIETQERAVELTRDVELRAQLTQRLEMFRRARGG
jgi:tetratricopeptide (TPR) repeat protein